MVTVILLQATLCSHVLALPAQPSAPGAELSLSSRNIKPPVAQVVSRDESLEAREPKEKAASGGDETKVYSGPGLPRH